jgi:hypothetical protein
VNNPLCFLCHHREYITCTVRLSQSTAFFIQKVRGACLLFSSITLWIQQNKDRFKIVVCVIKGSSGGRTRIRSRWSTNMCFNSHRIISEWHHTLSDPNNLLDSPHFQFQQWACNLKVKPWNLLPDYQRFNLFVPPYPDPQHGGNDIFYCIQIAMRTEWINIHEVWGSLPSDLSNNRVSYCKQIYYCLIYT